MAPNRRNFLRQSCDLAALAAVGSLLPHQLVGQTLAPDQKKSDVIATNKPKKNTAESWKLFRGNEFATGEAKSCLPDKLDLLWKYEIKGGAFEATPAIIDGVCYVPDLDGFWHAINLTDGKEKWKKKTDAFAFAASPAFKDDRLYVGDIDGFFYCYDLTGKEIWKFEAGAEISSSATFYKDKVLFGCQDARLYCLDRKTGKPAGFEKIEVQDQIRCSPTVVADRSFVAGCDGHLHIIDLNAGKELAAIEIDSPTGVTPAIMGDNVFFGTEAGEVFAIDWKKAEVKWRFTERSRREIRSSAAVSERMLVVGSRSKNVYGIDPMTGEEKWKFTCRRGVQSSPLIACDRVFVAATDGRVYLLDLLTGKELWNKQTGDSFTSSPAVVDHRLLIASNDGVVYCFGKDEQAG